MMHKNVKLALIIGTAVALGVMLCFLLRPGGKKTPAVIRVGVLKHESTLAVYIADAMGYFQKHNVEVRLIELPPADHLPALLADRVDIVSPTSFPMLFGIMLQHAGLLYALLPGAEVTGGQTVYGLVVKSGRPGESLKDLRGGVIMAINPYTKVNIQMILNSAGIARENWPEIRVASREASLQAVASGTATAAIMDQPALALSLESGTYRLLESNPRAKYLGSPYWSGAGAVKQEVWNRRRQEFTRFMAAIDDAILTIRRDPRTSQQTLLDRLELPPRIAAECGGYYFPLTTETVPKDGIEITINALRAAGLLDSQLPLPGFFPPGLYGEK